MNKVFTLIFSLVYFTSFVYSQSPIDSIKNTISDLSDVQKIEKLNELYLEYKYNEAELSVQVAKLAFEYSKHLNNDTFQIRPLVNISLGFYYAGNYDSVLFYVDKVTQKCINKPYSNEKNIQAYLAQIVNINGIILYKQSDFDGAIDKYLRAEQLYRELGDSSGMAKVYNNIAVIYRRMDNFHKAKEYYFKSIEIHQKRNDSTNLGISYNNVAILFATKCLNKPDSLLLYTKKAIHLNRKTKNLRLLSVNYQTLGNYFSRHKNYDSALFYLKSSIEIKKSISYIAGFGVTYNSIADVYFRMGNYDSAAIFVDSAMTISLELDDKDILDNNYFLLYRLDSVNGNYKSAFYNFHRFHYLQEEIYRNEVDKRINQLETNYLKSKQRKELEIRDLEIANNQEKLKRKNITIIGFIGAFLLVIIFMSFIFKQNKKIKIANKKLEEQNVEINQQKEEITAQRDDILEKSAKIETQNKDIKASISYAARIQQALLTQKTIIDNILPNNFIFFKPRDIVSGDFYWAKKIKNTNKVAFTAADCTGHGVPGALMSMLGISFLNEIITIKINTLGAENISAGGILDVLKEKIIDNLHQEDINSESKDGMDMVMCIIDFDKMVLNLAGANNSVFIVRNAQEPELIEIKGDRMPIGFSLREQKNFENKTLKLQKNDVIYSFSDGFVDQFGGKNNQKYYKANFKKFLLSIQHLNMNDQKQAIYNELKNWTQNKYEQIDDILIFGVKVSG